MLGVDESVLHYVPNGVPSLPGGELERIKVRRAELLRSIGIAPDAQVILTVGRISLQKGHDLIVPAIDHIAREFPRVKFLWLGGIDEAWRLELLARLERHGGSERVLIVDHVRDPRAYYGAADLFLFPSRCEGQSLALAEAMSFGLPIVASDASGNTELIRPDRDGIVFRTEDSCDLMEALRRALRTPVLMNSLAKSAQERVKMFSEERMLRETMRILGIESRLGAS
jgi:glycosyltransferase involved in cell wall biosynthesis